MTYIVLEMQTDAGVTAIVPPLAYTDRNAAESKFHQVLSVAATSTVEEHAASLITSDGRLIRNECYHHPKPVEEEESTEEPET